MRADLRAATKENTAKSGVAKEHLEKLQAGLMWQKLEHMSNRMLVLIEKMRTKREDGGKRVSPEDIVRLYDSLTNNFSEMGQLVGYREDEGTDDGASGARAAVAKAFRCYYVAESYGAAAQWKEASPPSPRATLLEDAAAQVDGSSPEASTISTQLDALIDVREGARPRAGAGAARRRPPLPHTHTPAPALPFHPPPPPPLTPCSYHQACILKIVGEPEVAAAGQDVSELSLAHGARRADDRPTRRLPPEQPRRADRLPPRSCRRCRANLSSSTSRGTRSHTRTSATASSRKRARGSAGKRARGSAAG